ncbi:MAG: allantoinase AllB [Bacillota bacterium]
MRKLELKGVETVKADRLFRGGTVVDPRGQVRADVAVRDGRIVALTDGIPISAHETVDVSGKYLLPGIIDTHVHIRYPGYEKREDFASGTRAAAAGGVTTILEHPISVPAVSSADILRRRWEMCRDQAYVDYAFFGAAGEDNIDQIAGLAEAGVVAFKTFLHQAPPGREREFEGLTCTTDGGLYEVFRAVARTGKISVIHAESNSMVEYYIDKYRSEGRNDILAHMDSRPALAEIVSAAGSLEMAEAAGVRLQVAHISGGTVADYLERERASGRDVLVETCPHYLFLTREDASRLGPYAKINPPIRTVDEQEGLWRAIGRGVVDFIGSDHGPFTREEKEAGWEDIWGAPAGAVGLETTLALMLDAVNSGRLSLLDVARLLSEKAAREFGLWPRKGRIAPGSDADLVVVDMDRIHTFDRSQMYTRARECALLFDGRRVRGMPVMTVLRGEIVMKDAEVVGEPGYGRMITT